MTTEPDDAVALMHKGDVRGTLARLLFRYAYPDGGQARARDLPPGTDWGPHNDSVSLHRADEVAELFRAYGWRPPLTEQEENQ